MHINETREKNLSIAKTAVQSAEEAFRFPKEHLTALNMGNEQEEPGNEKQGSIDPTKYLNRKETMQWNRLPTSKQEQYIKEGIKAAGRAGRIKNGLRKEADGAGTASKKTADLYRMDVRHDVEDIQAGLRAELKKRRQKRCGQGQAVSAIERAPGQYQTKESVLSARNLSAAAAGKVVNTGTSVAGGIPGIAGNAGRKAADKFREYMQEKAMAAGQAMDDVEQRLNNSREANHAMDTMPKAIRYTAATVGAAVTAVTAGIVQAVFSLLTALLAAVLSALIPVIAVVSILAVLIGMIAGLISDTQAGHGLPTFVTQEMMQAFFETQQESGIPVSSGVAQLIVESGFGSYGPGGEDGKGLSQLAYEYRNLFGIKYFSGDRFASGSVGMSTGEETGSGNVVIDADFAVYPDYASCIRQRAWMLRHSPYESHVSPYLNRNDGNYTQEDAKHFVEGIRAAGWATAQAYVDHCVSVMDRYDLYQFDNMTWEQYQQSMEGGGSYDGTVTEQMQRIVDVAQNNRGTYPCTPDMCAAWVTGVYQAAGASVIPYGDAIDMWNTYQSTGSTSMDNIPPGAIVCGSGSGYMGSLYGHVGVYLGNGMVANNVGHFSIETLSNWCAWQTATCQGHTGWIGWIYPGGVPD